MHNFFLNNKKLTFITKSISFLHPIRILNNTQNKPAIYKKNIFFIISKIICRYYFFYKDILLDLIFKKKDKLKHSKIIIISHFLKKEYLNNKGDFYFGKLPIILKNKNITYFRFLINHTKLNSSYLNYKKKIYDCKILENNLGIFQETVILFLQIKELFKIILLKKNRKLRHFSQFLLMSLFDSQTKFSIRIYFIIRNYIRKINPDILIFTHEGHGWERLSIKAAKDLNKNIKCIGYQHIMMSKYNFSLLRKIKGNYNPDIIWSNGIISKDILVKSNKLNNVKILKTGYLKKKVIKKFKKKINNKILVIPEGIYTECAKLFKFSIESAKKNKNLYFIWRLHPVIDKKILSLYLNLNLSELPKNITISSKSLKNDSLQSSYVIYRGSAAVLDCIRYGCFPILLKEKNKIYSDPLEKLNSNKVSIFNDSLFLEKILYKINLKSKKNLIKTYKSFYERAYSNIDESKILSSLK